MIDVSDFYDRHPISEAQVLDAVRRARGGGDGALTASPAWPASTRAPACSTSAPAWAGRRASWPVDAAAG